MNFDMCLMQNCALCMVKIELFLEFGQGCTLYARCGLYTKNYGSQNLMSLVHVFAFFMFPQEDFSDFDDCTPAFYSVTQII